MVYDLKQLHYMVEAARHGSFRRAALALDIEESSLSRQIRQLEHGVGAPLFTRSRAGVSPTLAGERFLRGAAHLVQEFERMTAATRAIGRGESGGLTVGFFTSLTAGNLHATVFEFESRFSDVEVRGVEDERAELMTALAAGSIDIVIVSGLAPHPGVRRQTFWTERIWVALSKEHPLAQREQLYWADLRSETFLGSRYTGSDVEDLVLANLVQPGRRPVILRRAVTRESILAAVGAGRGITLVCEATQGTQVANVVLRELHDLDGPVTLGFSGYWRPDNRNPALRRLLEFVRTRYSLGAAPD